MGEEEVGVNKAAAGGKDTRRKERSSSPIRNTFSARSSSALAPCMTMTLAAISSHL